MSLGTLRVLKLRDASFGQTLWLKFTKQDGIIFLSQLPESYQRTDKVEEKIQV